MFESIPQVAEYLAMTGQKDCKDLMSGACQFGPNFILDELVPKALRERKKIVWVDDPETANDAMLLLYRFERL